MVERPGFDPLRAAYIGSGVGGGLLLGDVTLHNHHIDLQTQPLLGAIILVGGGLIGGFIGFAANKLYDRFLR